MSASVERLEAMLARLPVLDDQRHTIRAHAANLAQVAVLAKLNELPRAKNAGPAAAGRSLQRLIDLSLKLHSHIASMPRDALGAMEAETAIRHPLVVKDDLKDLILLADRALARLGDTTPDKKRTQRATAITLMTVMTFCQLTGRTVGRSNDPLTGEPTGPLYWLLEDVFQELGIKANVDRQLRDFMDNDAAKRG